MGAALALSLGIAPEWAQGDDTCSAELVAVDASSEESASRLDAAFKTDDQTQKCDAIRHHIEVMRNAGDVFDRCTTGHGREENLGQVIDTIVDLEDLAVSQGCP